MKLKSGIANFVLALYLIVCRTACFLVCLMALSDTPQGFAKTGQWTAGGLQLLHMLLCNTLPPFCIKGQINKSPRCGYICFEYAKFAICALSDFFSIMANFLIGMMLGPIAISINDRLSTQEALKAEWDVAASIIACFGIAQLVIGLCSVPSFGWLWTAFIGRELYCTTRGVAMADWAWHLLPNKLKLAPASPTSSETGSPPHPSQGSSLPMYNVTPSKSKCTLFCKGTSPVPQEKLPTEKSPLLGGSIRF